MAFTHAYKGVVLCHILIGYPAITRRLLGWRVCKVADPMIEAELSTVKYGRRFA
jgi:hypothetical protein